VAPSITTQPTNQTVSAGQTATFIAAASGSPAPTVQWQVSTDGGATYSNVAGATSTTLSFSTTIGQNGNLYHAVFTNVAGTATTNPASLTVIPPPAVSGQIAYNDGYTPDITTYPNQRSMVTQVVVTFNAVVTLDTSNHGSADPTGAITVQNLDTGTYETGLHFATDNSSGHSALTVTFNANNTTDPDPDTGGSVADGNYTVIVHANLIQNASPDHQTMVSDFQDYFYRLFGDLFGTRRVNNSDASVFTAAYFALRGSANYLQCLDYTNAGRINNAAASAFTANYFVLLAPPPALPPTTLTATQDTGNPQKIDLSWLAPTGPTPTTYNIYRGTSSGNEILVATVTGTTFTYIDGPLAHGTYYYKVTAVYGSSANAVESTPSNEATAVAQLNGSTPSELAPSGSPDVVASYGPATEPIPSDPLQADPLAPELFEAGWVFIHPQRENQEFSSLTYTVTLLTTTEDTTLDDSSTLATNESTQVFGEAVPQIMLDGDAQESVDPVVWEERDRFFAEQTWISTLTALIDLSTGPSEIEAGQRGSLNI
jgi:hypothetical protein